MLLTLKQFVRYVLVLYLGLFASLESFVAGRHFAWFLNWLQHKWNFLQSLHSAKWNAQLVYLVLLCSFLVLEVVFLVCIILFSSARVLCLSFIFAPLGTEIAA